mmetsp:Transcript_28721/g.47832  ORF Transcript_28721/g.47832 Transcript_28721/m.47832 type:complete len:307 (+) Transcript_28721:1-921(+)
MILSFLSWWMMLLLSLPAACYGYDKQGAEYGNNQGYLWETFRKPNKDDKRSPCPAINTVANHGLINRDGKNIHMDDLAKALFETFGMQIENTMVNVLALSNPELGFGPGFDPENFDLDELIPPQKPFDFYGTGTPDTFDARKFKILRKIVMKDTSDESESDITTKTKITVDDFIQFGREIIYEEKCNNSDFTQEEMEKFILFTVGDLMNALFFATEEDFENRVLDKRQLRTILKRNKFPCNWEPRDMTNEFNVVGNQLQDLVEQVNPPFPQEIQGLIAVLKEELYFGPLSLEMAGALFDAFSAECE